MAVTDYAKTMLWQKTLAQRAKRDDDSEPREHLRYAYNQFRKRVELLAAEIHRDHPDFPPHDIMHSDALWEKAALIAGADITFTPTEAFVLGGAFLIHDLGMALASYQQGGTEFRSDPIYKDSIAGLYLEKYARLPLAEELLHPDIEIEQQAIKETLRALHAKHAEGLTQRPWQGSNRGQPYYLIEDSDLQLYYGKVIGRIAHSHGESVLDLMQKFPIPLGAPPGYPNTWRVDTLKLACLLRLADASHIDGSRAPGFLQALRKLKPLSKAHWTFQKYLNQPTLENDRLTYTSGQPFSLDEAQAWWLCFDTLRMIDYELRQVDALLADTRPERFAARGVTAVDAPDRLREYIPTEGWIPVDTHIQVTDLVGLIQNIGGEGLYGQNMMVPLRELIQNATDAIRARKYRRLHLPKNWGEICVSLGEDECGHWIEVEDNGVGMSPKLMSGPLLDFGKSYWQSDLMRLEYPGLLSSGFKSTGKYGIGFFSVFMWGNRVRITSRQFEQGERETKVLEFNEGLASRPILRDASENELIHDGGTRIRVYLKDNPYASGGLLFRPGGQSAWTLAKLCAFLCPGIDANLYIKATDGKRELVISSLDWVSMDGRELLRRTWQSYRKDEGPDEEMLTILGANLRQINDSSGNPVGRACVIPHVIYSNIRRVEGFSASVTVGGLRATYMTNVAGIFIGSPMRASRDAATPIVEESLLAEWASEQAELANNISSDPWFLEGFARIINVLGGVTKNLPIAYSSTGWMIFKEIAEWTDLPPEMLLMSTLELHSELDRFRTFSLNENVLAVESGIPGILQARGFTEWPQQRFDRSMETLVLKALARAWSTSVEKILEASGKENRYTLRDIGQGDGATIKEKVRVIKNPQKHNRWRL